MNKYEKTKKMNVAEYKQGDHVSLFVPRNIHHAIDRRRLACIVINKSSGRYPTYKLLSDYGVLNRRFTGNALMPFPGIIKAGPPTRQVSLSEAYKISQASEAVFCHCKTTCNTKSCRCYSASKLCSSRCHKHNTRQCSNYGTSPERSDQIELAQKYSFPIFGGEVNINGSEIKFLNTCAVDTWISIFNVILTENELFLENKSIYFEEHAKNLLQIIKRKDFGLAKWEIAEKTIYPRVAML